jgi:sugar O-acyltransferase (sialic acid O-acetyltransferase NeuD family)
MVIIGAGGFAKELLEIFQQKGETGNIAFYDDVNADAPEMVFKKFPVLKNETEVQEFFKQNGNEFTIGIGNPRLRYKLYQKFVALGGILASVISPRACIGSFEVNIGTGSGILDGAVFSNCTATGLGCIVYYNAIITHNCKLGNFVQVSPAVSILGTVGIDDMVLIGANAIILPKLNIGKHAVIAAGAVITKSVPDHALMVGNPAKRVGWVSEYGVKLLFDDTNHAVCSMSGEQYGLKDNIVTKIEKKVGKMF